MPQNYNLQFDTPQRESFFKKTSSTKLNREKILGKGSYGIVYSATYKSNNVAVKIIAKKDDFKFLSLKRESNILHWNHRNIVRIFKIVESIDYGAIVMEKCKNAVTLQNILDHYGHVALCHRVKILLDISCALNYCHSNQIIHGDVKPLNVMVVIDDSQDYVCKLFDFGCSFHMKCDKDVDNITGTARY